MSSGAIRLAPANPSLPIRSLPDPDANPKDEQATLLGLYYGYDRARVALARVVSELGAETTTDDLTSRRIWSRVQRAGVCPELFEPAPTSPAGVRDGAHSAALTAFAAISEKAEETLGVLRERWPELREDAGGPLPAPSLD